MYSNPLTKREKCGIIASKKNKNKKGDIAMPDSNEYDYILLDTAFEPLDPTFAPTEVQKREESLEGTFEMEIARRAIQKQQAKEVIPV